LFLFFWVKIIKKNFHQKSALVVSESFFGEKNGKEIGKMSFIVQKDAQKINKITLILKK
mgnify:CR=1